MEEQSHSHAIMFPLPYQGHLTPMATFAIALASKAFTVTFVQTEFMHCLISKAASDDDSGGDMFTEGQKSGLDIRYSTISDGFPPEYDRYDNFGEYWATMYRDFPSRVDEIVETVIRESGTRPGSCFLVADSFYSWPATIAEKHGIVYVSVWTEPAAVLCIAHYMDLIRENGHLLKGDTGNDTMNYIPGVESITTRDLMSYLKHPAEAALLEFAERGFDQLKKADLMLCNTVQELEPSALSAMNHKHPTYAIGPINVPTRRIMIGAKSTWPETDCTQWLESKPPASVLYVSFGSVLRSDREVIEEIARGILLSRVSFIWVLRPDILGSNLTDILSEEIGNELRVSGLMVPWCDQETVLSSSRIGGFLTHCGWNSVLESMWNGVPMICYPLATDQFTNRKLVVDDWKIGLNLVEGIGGVTVGKRQEIADKIGMLMRGETSVNLKREMDKVKKTIRDAVDGSSRRNFDEFVKDLKVVMKEKIMKTGP